MKADSTHASYGWLYYFLVGFLLIGTIYIVAYVSLGRYVPDILGPDTHSRQYDYEELASIFRPLGWVEAKVRGATVVFLGPDGSLIDNCAYGPGW